MKNENRHLRCFFLKKLILLTMKTHEIIRLGTNKAIIKTSVATFAFNASFIS